MNGRRLFLLGLPGITGRGGVPDQPPAAFHYAAAFSEDEARWYSRFDILVTGGILDRRQTDRLRRAGVRKLIAYEWTSAFYPGDPVSASPEWQSTVAGHAEDWLIRRKAEGGGAAEPGKTALWYDFADSKLISARVDHLAGLLRREGYDGFFFDTPGSEYLPLPIRRDFDLRHPGARYDSCMGAFFSGLRRALPKDAIIFTNQGYRHAAELLPHAGFDLSESSFTTISAGETVFRPWHDSAKPWEAIRTPFKQLIGPALEAFPKVKMVHVNYAAGSAEVAGRALVYGHCCAKLFGHDSYLIVPSDSTLERREAYFQHLGKPAGEIVEESASVVWRAYENGVVLVQSGGPPEYVKSLRTQLPGGFLGVVLPKK